MGSVATSAPKSKKQLIEEKIKELEQEHLMWVFPALFATRIMFSKGMVSKSKYWISEKNKGMSVSICLHFKGIFQSQYSFF